MKNNKVVTVNHWGKWVSSDIPVTGVLSNNSINWEYIDNEICLDCEQAMREEDENNPDNPDYDYIECDGSHTKLIGDWVLDTKTGQYEPSKDCEFAAIIRESVTQVVKSKYTQRGALCSPCYPGQVDLDSDGEFLGYTLPPELIYKQDEDTEVQLIASGYEWICPSCDELNHEIEVTESVTCGNCQHTYNVSDYNHATRA